MALSVVDQELSLDVESIVVLGPITSAGSRRRRLRLVLKTDGAGTIADYYQIAFAGGLSVENDATLDNLEAGVDMLGFSSIGAYTGTTKYQGGVYVSVGNEIEYTIVLPEFEDDDRYLVLAFTAEGVGGTPVPVVSAYVESIDGNHNNPVPQSIFAEYSAVANTVNFHSVGPIDYEDAGGVLTLDFGSDNSPFSTVTVSVALVSSDDEDQDTFDDGRSLGARTVNVEFGSVASVSFDIPADPGGGDRWLLVRMSVGAGSLSHTSLLASVEGPPLTRTTIPITRQGFGAPVRMHGGDGVTSVGTVPGARAQITGPNTFILVTNAGPVNGYVTLRAQSTVRPRDAHFPAQAVEDLVWAVDDDSDTYVFGPIPPAYVNDDGYVEIDVTDDGAGGDINWQFRAIRLVG